VKQSCPAWTRSTRRQPTPQATALSNRRAVPAVPATASADADSPNKASTALQHQETPAAQSRPPHCTLPYRPPISARTGSSPCAAHRRGTTYPAQAKHRQGAKRCPQPTKTHKVSRETNRHARWRNASAMRFEHLQTNLHAAAKPTTADPQLLTCLNRSDNALKRQVRNELSQR
jgi:hypothetical protein